ncbi:hypothetical protein C0J52_16326 [Blattella germanica]|nr:hypothetical protein C0J52_16326 [Blattella germanica]
MYNPATPQYIEPVTCRDVEEAIQEAKTRKAAGPDNIYNEQLKLAVVFFKEIRATLMTECLVKGRIPDSWRRSRLKLLYKEAFMAHVEKDAAQRAADRKERKEIADTYKRKGNDAFRKKEYEKALDFYTKAIEKIKDNTLLYVNRALTAINLGLYSRAISDCEWAHKLSENNLKAWLYKAKAHYQLGDYEKAMECLREAEKRNPDPESKTLITEYTISWNFNEDKEGSD